MSDLDPSRTLELIRLRAYELWSARGGVHGSPERDWLDAEHAVLEELATPPLPAEAPSRVRRLGLTRLVAGRSRPAGEFGAVAEWRRHGLVRLRRN